MEQIYSSQEASKLLKVSIQSLRLWERSGKLIPHRSMVNRKFYTESQICKFLNLPISVEEVTK